MYKFRCVRPTDWRGDWRAKSTPYAATRQLDKMQEYMDNNARLGWLIDPKGKQVEIYRQGQEKEVWQEPAQLSVCP